jgi:hypothetical protein
LGTEFQFHVELFEVIMVAADIVEVADIVDMVEAAADMLVEVAAADMLVEAAAADMLVGIVDMLFVGLLQRGGPRA